jgi:hypothetical protein
MPLRLILKDRMEGKAEREEMEETVERARREQRPPLMIHGITGMSVPESQDAEGTVGWEEMLDGLERGEPEGMAGTSRSL